MMPSTDASSLGGPASGWRLVAVVSAVGLVALIAFVIVLAGVT